MFDFDKRLEMTWFAFENWTFSFFDVNVIICINNSIKFRINHYGDGINSIVYIACYVQLFKYQYKKFPWSHFCSLNFEIFYWIFRLNPCKRIAQTLSSTWGDDLLQRSEHFICHNQQRKRRNMDISNQMHAFFVPRSTELHEYKKRINN